MAIIRFGNRRATVSIALSGTVLLGVAVLVWMNLSTPLSDAEAETRVRTFLSREVTRQYMRLVMKGPGRQPDVEAARQMEKQLRWVKGVKFVSVDVARLLPDFVLRPHRPTHIVRVVLRDQERQHAPRYFWLPWGGVDTETSRAAWYFAL